MITHATARAALATDTLMDIAALATDAVPEPKREILPQGWRSAFDPKYSRKYYFDPSGAVQWELPTTRRLDAKLSPVTQPVGPSPSDGRVQERCGQSMQPIGPPPEVAGPRSPILGPRPSSRASEAPVLSARERRRENSGVVQVFTNAHLADADLAAKRIQEIFQRKHRSRVQRLKTAGAQRARGVRNAVRTQMAERQARLAERQARHRLHTLLPRLETRWHSR